MSAMLWWLVGLFGAGVSLAVYGFTLATTAALDVESSGDWQIEEGR